MQNFLNSPTMAMILMAVSTLSSGYLAANGIVGVPPELVNQAIGAIIIPAVAWAIENFRTHKTGQYQKPFWKSTRFQQTFAAILALPAASGFLASYGVHQDTVIELLFGGGITSALYTHAKTNLFDLKRIKKGEVIK